MTNYDIIIVGGGPAGLTAATYAGRAERSVLILEKNGFGGQIAQSPRVDNFPGIPSVSGAERPQAVTNSRADRAAQSTHEIFMGTLPFASACRAE